MVSLRMNQRESRYSIAIYKPVKEITLKLWNGTNDNAKLHHNYKVIPVVVICPNFINKLASFFGMAKKQMSLKNKYEKLMLMKTILSSFDKSL